MKKIIVGIFILFLILAALYYFYFSRRISPVIEGRVYRSGQLSETTLEKFIHEKNIKSILNLRGEAENSPWYIDEKKISEKHHVKLYDAGISPNSLPECRMLMNIIDILLTSEKPLLIHCRKGVDRTSMVSALAISVDQDSPLSELKKQFSLRYGVLPFYKSIGQSLFSEYERWLNKTHKTHNKDNLIYWIRHEYHDSTGNLRFWIDHVNGRYFKDKKAMVPDDVKNILIGGWAYDTCTFSPPDNLYVIVDNNFPLKASYRHNRTDVARAFNLNEEYNKTFVVGWDVELGRETLSSGCHNISLRIVKNDSTFDIPTKNTFCFKTPY